jgi:hypothetical protein
MRSSLVDRGNAARRAHDERLRKPRRLRSSAESAQVPGRDRAEVGVDGRRRRALVLSELRRDLVRGDHMCGRQPPPHLVGHSLLVRSVAKREEEADRNRLGVERGKRRELERLENALGPDSLPHAEAPLERDQRLRIRLTEAIEVSPRLPSEMKKMLEAGRRDERGSRSLALEQRVRCDRRPVREAGDCFGADRPRRRDDRFLLLRACRNLRRDELAVREEDGVRERPADVDPEDAHGADLRMLCATFATTALARCPEHRPDP